MRRLPRSPPAAPLDDDNLLSEILLRLPPQPSSLPRASAVCKPWRSIASDPAFSRRFRRHHRRRRSPPLLGFFHKSAHGLSFVPALEAPNRVPPGRFSLHLHGGYFSFFGCRHGLALLFDQSSLQFLVWDPVTGQQHRLAIPPRFDPTKASFHAAVLCSAAAAAAGDVQDFKVVLVVAAADYKDKLNTPCLACVYSSQTRVWGDLISTPFPSSDLLHFTTMPAVLVGDSLYWELVGTSSRNLLEFDLERESLSVIPISRDVPGFIVIPAEGGGLGLLSMPYCNAQLWKRNTDSDGAQSWGMAKTIELDKLLPLNSDLDELPIIHTFAEDNNLVLMSTAASLFTFHLESLQLKRLPPTEMERHHYHTFESVYAAGI